MTFLQTRGMLAKLLATENLITEIDSTAKTASFDTINRVLKLPVFKFDNENVVNLLTAHECAHALITPQHWKDDVPDDVPFDFVNVIEDIRVEKYIQNKYPGLRVDFSKGYDELNSKDFFQIKDKDLSKFSLIDRINLRFKLGARAFVPFSDEELIYVKAAEDADTWQKVLLVSQMVYDYVGSKVSDTEDMSGDNPGNADGDETSPSNQSSNSNSGSDDEGADGDNQGDDIDGDDTSTKAENQQDISETQRAFDEALNKTVDNDPYRNSYDYTRVGDIDLDKIIVPVTTLRENAYNHIEDRNNGNIAYFRDELNTFLKHIRPEVNHMVQQFEMKKSADAYAREQIHKTGVLDTNRLHNYKLTDDIFLRQSITPDGKCHGMVMFLDWSGSMAEICVDTTKQIITLVQFCRKVQIPFDVYTFTTGDKDRIDREDIQKFDRTIAHGCVSLVQVLTSNAKKNEIDEDIFNLYCAALLNSRRGSIYDLPFSNHMQMGGTPLDNALVLVPTIINKFRQQTGAQKVSFVCISDGESTPIHYYKKHTGYDHEEYLRMTYAYHSTTMIRSGSKVFPIEHGTADVVNWLKSELTDVSISHIFLGKLQKSVSYVREYKQQVNVKNFRKTGCDVVRSDSWPLIGVINPSSFGDSDDELKVDDGATKAQIKTALNKMLKSKQSAKVILSQLVGDFA